MGDVVGEEVVNLENNENNENNENDEVINYPTEETILYVGKLYRDSCNQQYIVLY